MIKFARINDDAKGPYREEHSVGYDVFAYGSHVLNPGETKIIPLGFHAAIKDGYGAFVWDRSSFGANGIHIFRQLIENPDLLHEMFRIHTLGGCLDWSYRGQWGVILHNMTEKIYKIEHQAKIAQFVIQECMAWIPEEITMDALLAMKTARGQGGLGSTDGQNTAASAQQKISEAMSANTEATTKRVVDTGVVQERATVSEKKG